MPVFINFFSAFLQHLTVRKGKLAGTDSWNGWKSPIFSVPVNFLNSLGIRGYCKSQRPLFIVVGGRDRLFFWKKPFGDFGNLPAQKIVRSLLSKSHRIPFFWNMSYRVLSCYFQDLRLFSCCPKCKILNTHPWRRVIFENVTYTTLLELDIYYNVHRF